MSMATIINQATQIYDPYYSMYDTYIIEPGGSFVFLGMDTSYDPMYYYPYQEVYLNGEIRATFTQNADAIVGDCCMLHLYLSDSTIILQNANINLNGNHQYSTHYHDYGYYEPTRLYLYYSVLEMEGGSLSVTGSTYDGDNIDFYESTIRLTNTEVICKNIYLSGSDVSFSGATFAVVDNISVYGGTFESNNSTFSTAIYLNSGVEWSGSNNNFSSRNTICCSVTSEDDLASVFDFVGSCTADAPYVSICVSGEADFTYRDSLVPAEKDGFSIRIAEVGTGSTVTIEEGSSLHSSCGMGCYVYGTLKAEFSTVADAIVSTEVGYEDYSIANGGVMDFTRANINLANSSSALTVQKGGMLRVTEAGINTGYGFTVNDGATVEITDANITGKLKLKDGSKGKITDSTIEKLTLSLVSDVEIKGCDLSSTVFEFTDLAAGSMLDLSGNYWGTNDREVIEKRLGDYAGLVYLGELEGEYTGTRTYTVTNTADSGEGSLRWAIEQANAYEGTERTEIVFDESLAGSTIELLSDLTVTARTSMVNFAENPVSVTGAALITSAELILQNMVLEQLIVTGGVPVIGSGNVLTGKGDALRIDHTSAYLGLLEVSMLEQGAYIGLGSTVSDGMLRAEHLGLEYHVTGSSVLPGTVTVDVGETLVLDSGSVLDWTYYNRNENNSTYYTQLYVDGTLKGEGATLGGANAGYLYVRNGAIVDLKDTDVLLKSKNNNNLVLNGSCKFRMDGGSLDARLYTSWNTNKNAEILLKDVEINNTVDIYYGQYLFDGCVINSPMEFGYVSSSSNTSVDIRNCVFNVGLSDIEYSDLAYITGGNNSFASDMIADINIYAWGTSSNFDFEKLNSLVGSVESVSPYINISGYTNCETKLIAFDACERMEYRVNEPAVDSSYPYFIVEDSGVLNIEEGACLGISGGGQTLYYDTYMGYYPPQHLSYFVDSEEDYYYSYYYENVYAGVMVYGQIKAEFAGNADAIVTNEDRVRICVTGSNGISLKNANVRMTGQDNDLHVKYGGNIQADGGTIDITNGLHVEEGGSAVLSNLTLSADVYCAGALTLTDSRVESAITITGGSAVITGTTGLTELSISAGVDSVTLTDNDFSNTVFNIDSSVVLDLTGNYWGGLTDVDEIRSRYGLGSNVIVNSALEDSGNIQEFVFSVTNTADSGDGSLRQAVSKANAYTGSEVVRINISAALAGREISLGSNLSLNNKCIITGPTLNPLVLKGATLIANSEVSLKNITLPTLRLTGEAVVECESVVCTAERAIELTGWSGEADFSGVRATHSSAYVGISGLIAGDTALCALPTSFRGGYALYGATTIDEGAELTLADGVKLNMGTYQLIICGKLSQNNSVAANGLYSSGKACNVVVADGGELSLVNSHFVSANNLLRPMGSLAVESGGQLSLADSNVTVATFSVAGSAEMDGGTINANSATVKSGGSFAGTSVLIEHEFTAERGASLSMKDCVVGENLNISCTASLEKVSCARLVLGAGAAISSTGVGVTMTEEEALRLDGWSGSTEALFKSFTWNAIADGAYVGICGTIGGNSTFGILPTALRSGGYKLSGATTIAASTTTTLEEGVIWNLNSKELRIDGTLSIENENYAQSLISDSSAGVVIGDNGKLVLTNSGISFRQAGGSSVGKLTVNGGELVATDSVLTCADIIVNSGKADLSGGTVDARNTEVKSGASLTALGSNFTASLTGADGSELSLKNCSLAGTLTVGGKAELSSVTCGTLTLSSGSELVTDAVGVTLTGQNAIVLKNWHGSVDDLLDSFNWTATDAQARLGIAGNIAANSTFCALPDTLRGGYVLVDNTTVLVGAAVQLEDGVGWDIDGRNLYIKGALSAANTTARNALFNQDGGGNIYVHDGATVELEKAHISMTTADAKLAGMLYVYSGGELNMTEGNVQAQVVHVYGSVTLSDGRVNCNTYDVYSGGSLVLTDVTHSGNLSLRAGSVGTVNRVSINGNFAAKGKVSATDVSCATLIFGGDCDLTVPAGKITMSAREAIRLEDWHGNTAETLVSFAWKAEAEDAYVGIGGQITGNSVFAALPAALPGGYRLSSDVTIVAGAVVTLNEGIAWHADGKTLRVSGELRSVNETRIKALAWNNGAVIVQGGGKLLLTRADVDFGGGNSALMGTVNVSSGGMLSLSESELRVKTLTLAGSLALAENASLCVSDFRVNRNSSISSVDSRIEGNVYAKEAANLSFIRSEITGTLQAAPGAYLESFTCQTLELSTLTDLTVAGTGVTLTGAQALRLNSVCGGVSEALQLYKWNFADENSYVGLLGNLTADTTYTALPENRYTGGYKLVEQLTVGAGVTMSIGAGSKWNLNGCTLAVRGTVEINGEEEAPVELGSGKITLYEGSVLTSENVQSAAYVSVSGGAEISLTNTTLSGVNLTRDSVANLSGCVLAGQSTISLAADATISGNDLSKATIVLADTDERGVVDLSGNYWGTLDLLEITSRIRNYSEERVLISSILSSPPTQEFCFDAVMFGHHRLSDDATSLVLTFNRSVAANSVNAESLGLFDAEGNAVTGVTYEVNDNKVMLHFSPLSIGKYTVKATDKLLDVEGHSFSQSDNFANGIEYNCLEIGAPRVLLFRSNSTVTDVFSYVDLFFDQDMDSATISTDSVHLIGPDGKQVEFTHSLMAGMAGNIFYRFYFDPVTVKGAYQVQVDSSVRNDLGVAMDGGYVREVYVAAPDLVVQPDISYTDSTLGRYTTISYSVANAGDAMTPGTWTDSIYLCKTETWDADKAILFGRVNRTTALAEGESYTAQVRSLLGDLDFGSYYIFVKTDDSGRLSEADEKNNISATGKLINVAPQELQKGSAQQSLQSANEVLYYEFTSTADDSLSFSVNCANAQIFICEKGAGIPSQKNSIAAVFGDDEKTTAYFSAVSGTTYYITAIPRTSGTIQTDLAEVQFSLVGTSLDFITPGRAATITITGAGFKEGMTLWMQAADGSRVIAQNVQIVDSCTAVAVFAVDENTELGTQFNLMAADVDGTTTSLATPISVNSFAGAVDVQFLNAKESQRVGFYWSTDIQVSNNLGYDVETPIVLLSNSSGNDFYMYYDYNERRYINRTALMLLPGSNDRSRDIIAAGESTILRAYMYKKSAGNGYTKAKVLSPDDESFVTADMWDSIKSALKPTDITEVEWEVWWNDMKPRIGDTVGDVAHFIYDMQALALSTPGSSPQTLPDIVACIIREHKDYAPSRKISGTLTLADGTPVTNSCINLCAYIEGEWRTVAVCMTDEYGHFELSGLDNKLHYELKFSQPVEFDGEITNSISIDSGNHDVNLNLVSHLLPVAVRESQLEYTDDGQGNIFRSYRVNDEVVVERIAKDGSIASISLGIVKTFEESLMYWVPESDLLIMGWYTGTGDKRESQLHFLRWDGREFVRSSQIASIDGALLQFYINPDGGLYAVTETDNDSEISLTLNEVNISDDYIWSESESGSLSDAGESVYFVGESWSDDGVSFSFELFGREVSVGYKQSYARKVNESSATGELFFNGKFEPVGDIELTIEGSIGSTVTARFDCQAGIPIPKRTYEGKITVSLRHPTLFLKFTPLGNAIARVFIPVSDKIKKWTNLDLKLELGIDIEGTVKFYSGLEPGWGLWFESGKIEVFGGVESSYKSQFSGDKHDFVKTKISLAGEISDGEYDLSGSFEFSLNGIYVKLPWMGKSQLWINFNLTASYQNGFSYDFSFDFEKYTGAKKPAIETSSSLQGVCSFGNVEIGNMAFAENTSAYVYLSQTGALQLQYIDSQTLAKTELYSLTVDDEKSILNGFASILGLEAETDGRGNVYVLANGISSYINPETFFGIQSLSAGGLTNTFETIGCNLNGDIVVYDQGNFKRVIWGNEYNDVSQNVQCHDLVSIGNNTMLAWVHKAGDVYLLYTSELEGDTWSVPQLVYSSCLNLNDCEISLVDGELCLTFNECEKNQSGEAQSSLSYAFVYEEGKWKYEAKLNTEAANERYDKYSLSGEKLMLTLGEPEITRLSEGFINFSLSWNSNLYATYVLYVDGVAYDMGEATNVQMQLEDGLHVYKLVATSPFGQSIVSEEMRLYEDTTAPIVCNYTCNTSRSASGTRLVEFTWTLSSAESLVLIVDGHEYELDPDLNSYEIELGAGAHQYELVVTDGNNNSKRVDGTLRLAEDMQDVRLLSPEIVSVGKGGANVMFGCIADNYSDYCLIIDGRVYNFDRNGKVRLTLQDGEYQYTLSKLGGGSVAGGYYTVDTIAPVIDNFEIVKAEGLSSGEIALNLRWFANEECRYVLIAGDTRIDVGSANEASVTLSSGVTNVTLLAVDASGHQTVREVVVSGDVFAPVLSLETPVIESPVNGIVNSTFTWHVEDEAEHVIYRLWVNDTLLYEGSSRCRNVELTEDVRSWRVEAEDASGNVTVVRDDNYYAIGEHLVAEVCVAETPGESGLFETRITWNQIKGALYIVYIDDGSARYVVEEECSLTLQMTEGAHNYHVFALKNGVEIAVAEGEFGEKIVTPEEDSESLTNTEGWFDPKMTSKFSYTAIGSGVSNVTCQWYDTELLFDVYELEWHYYKEDIPLIGNGTSYGTKTIYANSQNPCSYTFRGVGDGHYEFELRGKKTGETSWTDINLSQNKLEVDTKMPYVVNVETSQEDDGDVTVEWELSEDKCTCYVKVNGKFMPGRWDAKDSFSFTMQSGYTYDVELWMSDAAGNVNSEFIVKDLSYVKPEGSDDLLSLDTILKSIPFAGLEKIAIDNLKDIDCPEGCPSNPPEGETCQETRVSNPVDPNEIYGPAAYGVQQWIAPQEMEFRIACENLPAENIAHAAIVTITHKIDSAYDYSTFRLGNMMIANNLIEIKTDVTSYKARLDWTDTLGIWADVNVFFDADTGEVTWEFTAIDPATGSIMSDPFKGLLAPNFNPPEGDGMVYYYIEPKSTTKTGTTASSQASIVFDYNEPILTPVLTYTFDADAPVATVQALAAESDSRYIMVNWQGSDKGSGLAGYNVYVSIDGEPWTLWQESITATGALYAVAEGEHTYAFFAQGMDYAGNAETVTELVMAEAATKSNYTPRSTELSVSSLSATREGALLTLQLVFNEAAECADWAGALQLLAPSGSIDLSKGVFRYDSVGNVLTWQGDISGIAEGETLHVRINSGLVTDAEGLPLGGDFTPSFSLPVTMAAAGAAYAAPCLTDYNNDGLLDLLVGEVSNGVGKVRLYLNEGTTEVAQFSTFSYLTTVEDTTLAVTAEGCQGAIVRLADLTGDGVAELLVGLADGTVRMYTAAEGGKWQDAGLLSCTVGGAEQLVSVGARAAIEVCDFNADGRTDLLVGTGTGNVVLYLDTATEGAAVFDGGQFLHDCDGSIRAASRASVTVADVDGDGLTDLLVGASDGIIRFYRNEGSNELPLFGKPVNIQSGDSLLDFSGETSRVRLSAADVDGDGFVDLMVGMADGSIRVLHGVKNSIPVGSVHAGDNPLYLVENVNVLVQGGGLLISWDAVDGESVSYEVSYCVSGQAESVIVPTSATSATLQLPDGSYELRVRAITQGGTGPWSEFATATIDTVAPVVPGSPQTAVGENGSAVLSWSATDSVASYIIRYKSVGASSWQTVSTESTSVSLTNLPGGDIVWQVCSIDAAGNTSVWSDESIFASTGTIPTLSTHWAAGMLFDADGNIIGGYTDANKTGFGDSSLCWAAAASNILAWWQQQYPTGSALNGVPQSAGDIYTLFCNSWENVAGSELYAFNWWLAGEEGSSSYKRFHTSYYCGNDDDGGWYSDYYNGANIANHTAQVSLQGVEVADISRAWTGIYNAGGMLALGVFRSISGSSLTGGHSLTLWGFCENEDGLIEQIYVTDSDDKTTSILTLNVEVDADSKLYRIAEGHDNLSGYYLGSYTYLKAGGMSPDGSTTEQAESLSLSSANDGSGQYSSSVLNWVGAGDSVDYYSITATGDGSYRLNIDTSTLETAVRVSVGVLNEQGEFVATEELLLTPDSAQGTLPGVAAVEGDKLYVKVESLAPENGGFYELNVDATVPSGGTGLVTQNNSSAVATESSADGETHRGWVGAGDVCDFYRVQMTSEGSLSFALSELESSARLRIYSERADGSLAQLDSRMVKSGSALEHTLSLTDGTYYIEIASADGGLGACNTSYSLTLQKEEAEADKRDKSDIAIV